MNGALDVFFLCTYLTYIKADIKLVNIEKKKKTIANGILFNRFLFMTSYVWSSYYFAEPAASELFLKRKFLFVILLS